MKNKILGVTVSVLIAEAVGFLSGILAGNSGEIYKSLVLPPLSPPGWIFPIVWTILYALMGIAAYLIFQSKDLEDNKCLIIYIAQLIVNFLWSIVFFRFNMYFTAVIIILILDILVFLMMICFSKVNKLATYLLVPYLAWILFATYLSVAISILN